MILYGIFEAYESQILFAKREVAAEMIDEHSKVTPKSSLKDRLLDQGQFTSLMGAMIGPQPEQERQDAFHDYMI